MGDDTKAQEVPQLEEEDLPEPDDPKRTIRVGDLIRMLNKAARNSKFRHRQLLLLNAANALNQLVDRIVRLENELAAAKRVQ